MELLPHAFLFRYAIPVPYAVGRPKCGRWPIGDDVDPLPMFSDLDRTGVESGRPAIDLRAVWNETGFGVSAIVDGLDEPPIARADAPAMGDGLHVWIDTRNAQGVHRATRFCHQFAILPAVGRSKSPRSVVQSIPIPQARDQPPAIDPAAIQLATDLKAGGYRIEAWFPSAVLHGFEPENAPRIGFHAVVKIHGQDDRSLTVGDEFPVDHDPSLWTTLELVRG